MKTPIQYMRFLLLVLLTTIGFQACTETEYLEYEEQALTRILEYRVTNAQQELLGAISHENNIIIVYVPYYLGIEYLNAEIKLDEGATLWDEEGNEINLDGGLAPVPLGDTVKYTVKSLTGAERVYTLIQKVQPHEDELLVTYKDVAVEGTIVEKPIYAKLILLGNLESTSRNAKFIFTDRSTGTEYKNFLTVDQVVPGSEFYEMTTTISPDALAGEYDVHMEHQGRTTDLPPIKLKYQRPSTVMFLSSARFAPGDEIIFTTRTGSTFSYPRGDADAGTFTGLKRIYLKIASTGSTVPAGFPTSLYDTPIPMEITSQSTSEIKAIFPEVPAGLYGTAYPWYADITIPPYTYYYPKGFAFYADYDEQTGWGDGVVFSMGYSFTVLPKP